MRLKWLYELYKLFLDWQGAGEELTVGSVLDAQDVRQNHFSLMSIKFRPRFSFFLHTQRLD